MHLYLCVWFATLVTTGSAAVLPRIVHQHQGLVAASGAVTSAIPRHQLTIKRTPAPASIGLQVAQPPASSTLKYIPDTALPILEQSKRPIPPKTIKAKPDTMSKTTFLLIRHAEKLDWVDGLEPPETARKEYVDNHLLSVKGYERAESMFGFFVLRPEMKRILEKRPLAAVVAQGVDTGPNAWGRSRRPIETVEPLVNEFNANETIKPYNRSLVASLPLQLHTFIKAKLSAMIHDLRTNPDYIDRTVIISWSHKQLPELAVGLGAPASLVPSKWQNGRFDMVWVIEWTDKNVLFRQVPQRLMYGDLDSVMPLK